MVVGTGIATLAAVGSAGGREGVPVKPRGVGAIRLSRFLAPAAVSRLELPRVRQGVGQVHAVPLTQPVGQPLLQAHGPVVDHHDLIVCR